MIDAIKNVQPILKPIRANLNQKVNNLKPLAVHPYPEYVAFEKANMIIPGGLDLKEKFYYKMTGKLPKSVQERWVEANGNVKISEGDQMVTVDKNIHGDYFTDGTDLHTIDISKYKDFDIEVMNSTGHGSVFDDFC